MSEQATLAAYRLSIYNPGRMSDSDITAAFVARLGVFERIRDDLHQETDGSIAQSHLIIGQRGMGKTTLLMRLAAELRSAPLRETFIPLTFVEEQYTVDRLSKFWINCLDSLADALEKRGEHARVERIDATVRGLERKFAEKSSEPEMEQESREALLAEADALRLRPVLLVDNIQLVFERIGKRQHNLRELLMRPGAPVLIGTAPVPPQAVNDYAQAFFDQFKEHYLTQLSEAEMRGMILSLAGAAGLDTIRRRVQAHPERVAVLHQITGGNPRTAILLFHLYAEDFSPSVFRDMEALLDRVTPYYKARFEELSDQQQIVAGAMANHWDPIASRQLSELTGLAPNQISPQLDRLQNLGFVERVRLSGNARSGYQIAERFFNIWYLMRSSSRRQRRQIEFLIRFLEQFYSSQERRDLARSFVCESGMSVDRMMLARAAAHATADSGLVQDVERRLELDALERQYSEARQQLKESIDFDAIPPATLALNDLRSRLIALAPTDSEIDPVAFVDAVLGSRRMLMRHERQKLASQDCITSEEANRIIDSIRSEQSLDRFKYGEHATDWLGTRIRTQIRTLDDLEDWNRTLSQADVHDTLLFGMMLMTVPDALKTRFSDEAFQRICQALRPKDDDNNSMAWFDWANEIGIMRYEEAEAGYRRALDIDPQFAEAWNHLGIALQHLHRYDEAEAAHLHALDIAPDNTFTLFGLGAALNYQHKYMESEVAYRRALAIDPRFAYAWAGLGYVLNNQGRYTEAEAALQSALKIDPTDAWLLNHLGFFLVRHGRFSQAVGVYLAAIRYDPRFLSAYENLICLQRDFLLDIQAAKQLLDLRREISQEHPEKIAINEALLGAYESNWGAAASKLAVGLMASDPLDPDESRIWFLTPAVLIHLDFGEQLIALLLQEGFDQRLRPWFEAIRAAQAGNQDSLQNIAPEVRTTAEWCFGEIMLRLDLLPEASRRRTLPNRGRGKSSAGALPQ